jgi:hypothetical protein
MISFRAKFRIAVFCALGIFVSFPVHPAFAQDLLSDKCLQFACAQSTKQCTGGGFLSTVTVTANSAIQGCHPKSRFRMTANRR